MGDQLQSIAPRDTPSQQLTEKYIKQVNAIVDKADGFKPDGKRTTRIYGTAITLDMIKVLVAKDDDELEKVNKIMDINREKLENMRARSGSESVEGIAVWLASLAQKKENYDRTTRLLEKVATEAVP